MIDIQNANDKSFSVICLCVFPNRWIGEGILTHAIHYTELKHFKRISKAKFAEVCPDFGQFRHKDTRVKVQNFAIETVPIRNESFGI
jgi:hypothetical protein